MTAPLDLSTLTAEHFAPQMHQIYLLQVPSGPENVPLRLISVKASSMRAGSGGGRAPFSLLFEGPAAIPLPQGTYVLSGPDGQTLEIFVVPIAGDARCRTYEAVFG